jgi:hypothetical protein
MPLVNGGLGEPPEMCTGVRGYPRLSPTKSVGESVSEKRVDKKLSLDIQKLAPGRRIPLSPL